MKSKIAQYFYDKKIKLYKKTEITDDEGGKTFNISNKVYEFLGNVNFKNCKKIQEEYGLDYDVAIAITTDFDKAEINDLISYNEVFYDVTDIIVCDSHFLILGKIWQKSKL